MIRTGNKVEQVSWPAGGVSSDWGTAEKRIRGHGRLPEDDMAHGRGITELEDVTWFPDQGQLCGRCQGICDIESQIRAFEHMKTRRPNKCTMRCRKPLLRRLQYRALGRS